MNSSYVKGWALFLAIASLILISPQEVTAQATRKSESSHLKSVVVGKLIGAGRTRNGRPKFALLDERGNMTSHVVPVAGLNLTKHINQQVGITVRSATRAKDKMPYILAQSVTNLIPDEKQTSTKKRPVKSDVWEFEDDDLEDLSKLKLAAKTEPPGDKVAIEMPEVVSEFLDIEPEQLAVGSSAISSLVDDSDGVQPVGASVLLEDHPLPVGEMIPADESIHDYDDADIAEASIGIASVGCNTPGCTSCGGAFACLPPDCCPSGPIGRYWFRGEYVLWWTKGMEIPDLVTTSPSNTAADDAGVRGVAGTSVLFGGDEVFTDSRNGARFRFGKWCDPCQWIGFEVDYFFMGEESDGFSNTSTGAPILARPFFNANLNQEDAELVAYPGTVTGAINVTLDTQLHSISPRLRINLRSMNFCTEPAMACGPGNGCGGSWCNLQGGQRLDFTLGYRYVNFEESLLVNEQLVTNDNGVVSAFNVTDLFNTRNDFHGVDIGLLWERYRGAWSVEVLGRVALGNVRQRVAIDGSTATSTAGVNFSDRGGILALQSNIGDYSNDRFSVMPEIGATLGYLIGPSLRFTCGYSFLYWNKVVRPGDQIDLTLNPDLFPPVQATTGPDRPAFVFNESDFWAQGLNFGLDYRW